jgi:hypothetical protein
VHGGLNTTPAGSSLIGLGGFRASIEIPAGLTASIDGVWIKNHERSSCAPKEKTSLNLSSECTSC